MSRRALLLAMIFLMLLCASAQASGPTRAMLSALDVQAEEYASSKGWTYVDRLTTDYRGNWKTSYVTAVFTEPAEITDCIDGKCVTYDEPFEWDVRVRITRCGPGWYVVSFPDEPRYCLRLKW